MKKLFSLIGMASGLFSIMMSFTVMGESTGGWVSRETYGGDAYTGIQNAAASTANNVSTVGDLIQIGMFAFLFAFGLACFAFFGRQFAVDSAEAKALKKAKDEAKAAETSAVPVVHVE